MLTRFRVPAWQRATPPVPFPILHLGQHINRQSQGLRRPGQQGQHRRFQLIFRIEMQGDGKFGRQVRRKGG
jgi:hypothetical protein